MHDIIRNTLQVVSSGTTLSSEQAEQFMNLLMEGEISPVQTAGLVAAMSVRGETVSEMVGFARAMRAHSVPIAVSREVVDTCGTGGDGGHTFNISTASAFVAAAAGAYVAKHGNRAVSSRSGSADVLQALGARIDLEVEDAVSCLSDSHICFLFAPQYHPAMKHAAQTRKELGFRTIFNILGPLTNPVGPKSQVLGVFRPELVGKVAEALGQLGCHHALVVHGDGGIDEFSISGETLVAEVKDGTVQQYTLTPEDVGLARSDFADIAGGTAVENAAIIRGVFEGKTGGARDVVVFNAGAVLYVSGYASSIVDGVAKAQATIENGLALKTLTDFVAATHRYHPTEVAQ